MIRIVEQNQDFMLRPSRVGLPDYFNVGGLILPTLRNQDFISQMTLQMR